jgi:hypothetical protein
VVASSRAAKRAYRFGAMADSAVEVDTTTAAVITAAVAIATAVTTKSHRRRRMSRPDLTRAHRHRSPSDLEVEASRSLASTGGSFRVRADSLAADGPAV